MGELVHITLFDFLNFFVVQASHLQSIGGVRERGVLDSFLNGRCVGVCVGGSMHMAVCLRQLCIACILLCCIVMCYDVLYYSDILHFIVMLDTRNNS